MSGYMSLPERYEGRPRWLLWAEGRFEEFCSIAWRRGGVPAKRFCIFAQGRTGSTLLTSSLDSHPEIWCPDEILRRPKRDPLAYLERYSRRCRAPCFGFHVKCYQFTHMQGQRDSRDFLHRLVENGWSLIHLSRRDVVAHAFSSTFVRHVGKYHFARAEAAGSVAPIRVEPERFLARIRERLFWQRQEARALDGLEAFRLVYEDHLLDPEARAGRLAELQDWLGVPRAPLKTPLQRSVPRSPWEMMSNPDEVRTAMGRAGLDDLVPAG